MVPRRPELVAASLWALAAAAAALLGAPPWVRAPLAVPLVAFLPGYALVRAASLGDETLARFSWAIGVSLGLSTACVLGFSFSPWGAATGPTATTLAAIVVACSIVAQGRPAPGATDWALPRGVGMTALGASALAAVVVGASLILAAPHPGFTEFSVTATTGFVDDLPREVRVGETVTMRIAIANHEGQALSLSVRGASESGSLAGGAFVANATRELGSWSARIEDGGAWTTDVDFAPRSTGLHRVAFTLDGDGSTRELHVWITASAP